jgi:ubiquinone/menaquinone biosynthesis C-methylase UbiE
MISNSKNKNIHDYTLARDESEKQRITFQAEKLYGGGEFLLPYLKKNIKVLEVGCGTGVITSYVANQIGQGSIVGIDNDEESILRNKKNNISRNVNFSHGDVKKLKFPDNSFDLTFSRFVLMHIPDPIVVIKEMIRVTKPGGYIVAHEGVHDAVWLSPTRAIFEKFLETWKKLMKKKGQDHSVGLRLHSFFTTLSLNSVKIQVMPHSFSGQDPLFKDYLENWRRQGPSLRKSLEHVFTAEDYSLLDKELSEFCKSDYLLELTIVGSGIK